MRQTISGGACIGPDARPSSECFSRRQLAGMHPKGGDLVERSHYKKPSRRARVRQCQIWVVEDRSAVGDEIEIEGAWRVWHGPIAAECLFYL